MSIFTRGAYTINFANTPYINAISKYNQKSYINKITDATGKVIDISENNKILFTINAAADTGKHLHNDVNRTLKSHQKQSATASQNLPNTRQQQHNVQG